MARAPQKQALNVIKEKIPTIEERYGGYRSDLVEALYDILDLENDPPHNIAQRVTRRIEALGELIVKNEGNIE